MLVTGRALVWAAPAELRQRFWDGWNLLRTVPQHIPMRAWQETAVANRRFKRQK